MVTFMGQQTENLRAVEFLQRFGVTLSDEGTFDSDDAFLAIRSKGWEPSLRREGDEWRAEIREWRTLSQSHATVARNPDPNQALLRALELALGWQSLDEEMAEFDRKAEEYLGISGLEFLQRLQRNELDLDQPYVRYLLVSRPLGV